MAEDDLANDTITFRKDGNSTNSPVVMINEPPATELDLVQVDLRQRRMRERFIRVPWHIYRPDDPSSNWVPPLLRERHRRLDVSRSPFFRHAEAAFWIVVKDSQDIGRISAVQDFDWQAAQGVDVGTFGLFECIDDEDVAGALVETASQWLMRRGMHTMVGPIDLSTNYVTGILVDAFDDEPSIEMPYNPPYYERLLLAAGLRPEKDLWEWRVDLSELPPRIEAIAERVRTRDQVRVRRMSRRRLREESGRLLSIYNEAWSENWGFVPIREDEMAEMAKQMGPLLAPDLTLMAEVDGEPVGFALTLLNPNSILKRLDGRLFPFGFVRLVWDLMIQQNVDNGRGALFGIRKDYRGRGIDSLLLTESLRSGRARHWTYGTLGWTADDNFAVHRSLEAMRARRVKTYRVYRMQCNG
jgi:GNAT superfamily N-acetyltransferase